MVSKKTITNFINAHQEYMPDLHERNIYNKIANDKFLHHMFNCWVQVKNSKKLSIPDIEKTTCNATVIIENRRLPGIEYLIRKVVHLLEDGWSHYVVCTDSNYDLIYDICSNIHRNINIIKLDITDVDHNTYNNLCLDRNFWLKINAEKILVYQTDCEIHHGSINNYLQYDFIGAPWPEHQDDNVLGVGNGGFSLRSRSCMLKCLDMVKPDRLEMNESTLNYINGLRFLQRPLDNPPEDVYYSKTMIDRELGKVASRDVAICFARETYSSDKCCPVGEHQYWLHDPGSTYKHNLITNLTLVNENFSGGDATQHAGGWVDVVNNLRARGVLSADADTLLVDCAEQYFAWDAHPVIDTQWIGIIHITPITPDYLNIANVNFLLNNANFKSSLSTCKCLIVLSEYLKKYIETKIDNVDIHVIKHPTTIPAPERFFDLEKFQNNKNLELVQVGQQMRYMSTIFQLNYNGTKRWLTGWRDASKMVDLLYKELQWKKLKLNIDEGIITYLEDPEQYLQLISNNIVFIHVIDASANNAILEMMARNIPVFVNKHPAIEEYLGSHYPLYFESTSHLQYMINDRELLNDLVCRGHMYLSSIDKHDITHDHFAGELIKLNNMYE